MKKIALFTLMLVTIITYSQKKKNGTIFIEHPAIEVVESMLQAFADGDADKAASYLAEDFKAFEGTGTDKDDEGVTKEGFHGMIKFVKENYDYVSIKRSPGAYPDALEYKDDDFGLTVQTWTHFKGVHKKTGVKIDMPMHRLFTMTDDNKIKRMIIYNNQLPFAEIRRSFVERKNGTIYNHHENINTVRRMIHAFENDDLETAYSFYTEKARLRNINMPIGETLSVEESKANDEKFKEKFEIKSIDVNGYPDYLNYGIGNAKIVHSWWDVRLIRKSDDKKIIVPVMFVHRFNDDGKITSEVAYFSSKLLE